MPYCIWITRAASYAAARRGDATPELDRAELEDLLDILEATERVEDCEFRLAHPHGGDAWCSVYLHPSAGPLRSVELSTSFTHASFPRNLADMFDLALRLARRLGARVFEESRGIEVTKKNIDQLLDPEGDFALGLVRFWHEGRKRLLSENRAPLEFPLGAIDGMSDYFVFEIPTPAPIPLTTLAAATPAHLQAHLLPNSIVLEDRESGHGAVRIGRFESGHYVRPYWSSLPFATLAREVLHAVERVSSAVGVRARYFGMEVDRELHDQIAAAAQRSGSEYVEQMGLLNAAD